MLIYRRSIKIQWSLQNYKINLLNIVRNLMKISQAIELLHCILLPCIWDLKWKRIKQTLLDKKEKDKTIEGRGEKVIILDGVIQLILHHVYQKIWFSLRKTQSSLSKQSSNLFQFIDLLRFQNQWGSHFLLLLTFNILRES